MIPIQHTMRQFTIRTRMYSAIAVVLVLLMAVAGVSLYGIEHHRSLAEAHEASSQVQNHHLAQMRSALGEARLHERDMLVMTGDASAVTQAHQQWQQALSRLTALAQQGPSVLGAAGQEALLALSTPLQTYQSGVDAAAEALGTASNPAREWVQQLQAPRAAAEQLGQALDRLGSAMAQQTQDAKAAQAHAMRQTWLLFGAVLLLAIVVVGPLTVLNQRSICRPLDKAEAMAAAIAAGDLSMAVHDQGQDEPAHLLRSLNQMRASLLAMVSNVRTTADSIATASTEIAAGNMDLSTRTENTASSLQSTASSMAQLTGTVHHSAEAAVQANALAQNAAGAAQRGNTIVSAVVANMGEIDSTSKRINDIIGVIDGIAFQTNILALNAAVEAARAGEQGRGFAVVAGEVRSLAQRSASAAREIKQLILASGEKVESGTRLVEDAGAAMSELIAGVQRVSDIIGEISNASREQNDGINQVNVAVTELDQMTQQNAALVEQSAAAAASLQAQARGLTQAMSVFRV